MTHRPHLFALLAAVAGLAACDAGPQPVPTSDPVDVAPSRAAVHVPEGAKPCTGECVFRPPFPTGPHGLEPAFSPPFMAYTTESVNAPGPTLADLPACPDGFDALDIGTELSPKQLGGTCSPCNPCEGPTLDDLTCGSQNAQGTWKASVDASACGGGGGSVFTPAEAEPLYSARGCIPRRVADDWRSPLGTCSEDGAYCVARPPGALVCIMAVTQGNILGCPMTFPAIYPIHYQIGRKWQDTRHCECSCVPSGDAFCDKDAAGQVVPAAPGTCKFSHNPANPEAGPNPQGSLTETETVTLCCAHFYDPGPGEAQDPFDPYGDNLACASCKDYVLGTYPGKFLCQGEGPVHAALTDCTCSPGAPCEALCADNRCKGLAPSVACDACAAAECVEEYQACMTAD